MLPVAEREKDKSIAFMSFLFSGVLVDGDGGHVQADLHDGGTGVVLEGQRGADPGGHRGQRRERLCTSRSEWL